MEQKKPNERLNELATKATDLLHTDISEASKIIDELLKEFPKNKRVLIANFSRYRMLNDSQGVLEALAVIEARNFELPPWLESFQKVIQNGEVEINGVNLLIDTEIMPPQNIFSLILGKYENAETQIVLEKLTQADRVLELGAGLGYIAAVSKTKHSDVPYLCFEANPKVYEIAKINRTRNNVEFEIVNGVVSEESGTTDFYIHPIFTSSSLLTVDQSIDKIQVKQYPIQEVLNQFKPNFLIMDIEGGEVDLIPIIDWSGITKLSIELHPRIMSNATYTNLMKIILNEGFIIDTELSGKTVLYFEKEL